MILSGMPMFSTSPRQRFFYILFLLYEKRIKRLMNYFF
ncbi:hypothetical protein B4110_0101 [Parageobacillus toebii]|uniref:Uncharacterized protein n=1 Tax=Parageobacillus toebii TaxID=153151 RepID=A0A150N8J6_9BACL|nr:hypothetical protein B4110_0101 [Parageobacillus toebii]